jgi:hypothetical protein
MDDKGSSLERNTCASGESLVLARSGGAIHVALHRLPWRVSQRRSLATHIIPFFKTAPTSTFFLST